MYLRQITAVYWFITVHKRLCIPSGNFQHKINLLLLLIKKKLLKGFETVRIPLKIVVPRFHVPR